MVFSSPHLTIITLHPILIVLICNISNLDTGENYLVYESYIDRDGYRDRILFDVEGTTSGDNVSTNQVEIFVQSRNGHPIMK